MEQLEQPVLAIPIKAKVSGTGVVRKADGSISYATGEQPEDMAVLLLRKVSSSLDKYWDEALLAEINEFLKEKDNGRNS